MLMTGSSLGATVSGAGGRYFKARRHSGLRALIEINL